MEAFMSMIKMMFISTLLITGVVVFCLVKFPTFREFCKRLMLHAAGTVLFCVLAFTLTIIYIVSPIDLIPDPIAGTGTA